MFCSFIQGGTIMKRVAVVIVGVVVLALIYATISGPMVGKVFSNINPSLSTGNTAFYGRGGGAGAPEEVAYDGMVDQPAAAPMDAEQRQTDLFSYDNQNEQQIRMVIKNADLVIVVQDPAAKMKAISNLAVEVGGYVVSATTSHYYLSDGVTKVPEGTMMIRVPVEKLDEVLQKIKGDVVEVQTDTLSGVDVTKEYTDLSSQLKNLQATEKKLTEIMEEANKTEDVLAVFNQLTQIRGQIEVIVGQMKYYEQSAAMSAVSVRILADKTIQPIEIAGWQPQGDACDAVQALVNFFQRTVSFLIWFVIFFIPVALVTLLVIFVGWRVARWGWRKFGPKKA
jgi:hypothetical protein